MGLDRHADPAERTVQIAHGSPPFSWNELGEYDEHVVVAFGLRLTARPRAEEDDTLDARTDLFALGTVLYEMVTGRAPFAGGDLIETLEKTLRGTPEALARFNHAVPAELERIILKCLRKAPEERYQSARELIVDLRSLQESLRMSEGQPTAVGAPASAGIGQVVTLLMVSTNGEELERTRCRSRELTRVCS